MYLKLVRSGIIYVNFAVLISSKKKKKKKRKITCSNLAADLKSSGSNLICLNCISKVYFTDINFSFIDPKTKTGLVMTLVLISGFENYPAQNI